MVELVVEYSQGIRRETLELNLYLNDLRVCYVEWLNIFKKKELWPLDEETFYKIVEDFQIHGYYISKPFSLYLKSYT